MSDQDFKIPDLQQLHHYLDAQSLDFRLLSRCRSRAGKVAEMSAQLLTLPESQFKSIMATVTALLAQPEKEQDKRKVKTAPPPPSLVFSDQYEAVKQSVSDLSVRSIESV